MAREDIIAHNNFRALNIPREIQNGWRQELFNILSNEIKKHGSARLFSRMYDISEYIRNKENLYIMKESLKYIKYNDLKTKANVSETILGRNCITVRSGVIFLAYDIDEKELAKELLMFVTDLLNIESEDEELNKRTKRDIETCKIIDSTLKLGVYNAI